MRYYLSLLVLMALSTSCAPFQWAPFFGGGEVSIRDHRIKLAWRTETESDSFGYYVYKSSDKDEKLECINKENPIAAMGDSLVPNIYVYYDLDVKPGAVYYYKIKAVDLDGSSEWIIGGNELS